MKKLFKNLGLSLAAFACLLCAGFGTAALVSNGSISASADIAASDYYVSGAGVRLVNDANGTGLRFHTSITKTEYEGLGTFESGTLIIPEIRYDGELTLEDLSNEAATRPLHIETTGKWYQSPKDENFMRSTVYMYNMPEAAYGARYYARSYVKVGETVTYGELSPAISMSDIALSVTNNGGQDDLTKAQVVPYIVENVKVTFDLSSGKVTKEFAYGETIVDDGVYNKDLYSATWTDQYGRTVEMGSAQATLPLTLTPVFDGAEQSVVIANAAMGAVNNALTANADLGGVAAPEGFLSVSRLDSATGLTSTTVPNSSYNGVDLSSYEQVRFALKPVNGFVRAIIDWNSQYGLDGDWVHFTLTQTGDDLWTVQMSTNDGAKVYAAENQVGNTIRTLLYDTAWDAKTDDGDGDGEAFLVYANAAGEGFTLYSTEVIGTKKVDVSAYPAMEAEEVLEHIYNTSTSYFGEGKDANWVNDVTAPDSYSKVIKYSSWASGFASWRANPTDLTAYSDLYYAVKIVNGAWIHVASNSTGDHYTGGDWLYVHFNQTGEGTWSYNVASADGSYTAYSKADVTGTSLKELMGNVYPHASSSSTEAYALFTELYGVLKDGSGSEETPDVEEDFIPVAEETYAVSQAFVNANGTTLVKNTSLGEVTVPNGFKTVSRFDSGSTFTSGSLADDRYDTTDLSAYSEVWVALKIDNGLLRVWNGWIALGTDGSWMYFHFTKTADSVWTIEITINGNVYTYEGQQGNTIKELTIVTNQDTDGQRLVIYHDDADTTDVMSIYSTELRTKRDEAWGERAIWSAADSWEPTEEWENPNKYTSIYKVSNIQKTNFANVFAKLDLGTDYEEIRFGLIADKDLVFNVGYRCYYDLNGDGVAEEVYTSLVTKTTNATLINQMNFVTLTKTADGWDVSITGKRWYQTTSTGSGGSTTETFTCSVTGKNSISEIMTEIFSLASDGTNLYVTEVRGISHDHVAEKYVSAGGTHQGYCWCGVAVGEPVECSGGEATCTALANCEVCGGEYGELASHVASVDGLTCKICGEVMTETTVIAENGFYTSPTSWLTDNADLGGVTAPAGFSTVTRKDSNSGWTSSVLNYQAFNRQSLALYSEAWVAFKVVNGDMRLTGSNGFTITDGSWITYHLTRTADSVWKIEIIINGVVKGTITGQSGAQLNGNQPYNSLAAMFYDGGYNSTDGNAILIYHSGSGTASVYSTEIRGIPATNVPKAATKVWDDVWRSDLMSELKTTTEPAPVGYSNVIMYEWAASSTYFPINRMDNSTDITVYSDIYFAMKLENGSHIYCRACTTHYTTGGWLFVHYKQTGEGVWTMHLTSFDGYERISTQTYEGSNLKTLMDGNLYPHKVAGDAPAYVYFTEMYAIPLCDGTNHTAYSYTSNGDGTHTVTCSCGTVMDSAAACDGTATCIKLATCSLCGGEHGALNASNHATTMVTYVSNGDDTHTKTYACCGAVIETVACSGGTATCGTLATCDVCKTAYGTTSGEHTSTEFTYVSNNDDTHNKLYACCGAVAATEACSGEWDGNAYSCTDCKTLLGTVNTEVEQQAFAIHENAEAITANVKNDLAIDLSFITEAPITSVSSFSLNGVKYAGTLSGNVFTIGVIPKEVFGEYTAGITVVVYGRTFEISLPAIVVTNMITTAEGMLNMKYVLRGENLTTPDEFLSIGGRGGDATMNGDGYYMLGNDIALTETTAANVYVWGTSHVPFVGTFDGNGYTLKNFKASNWFSATEVVVDSPDGIEPKYLVTSTSNGVTTYKEITATTRQDNYLNETQIANGTNVNSGVYGTYLEASLFGVADGTVKNVAFTNVQLGIFANIVHSGSALFENIYVEVVNLQEKTQVYVPNFFARGENGAGTLRNVVFNLKNHNSSILASATNTTTEDSVAKRYLAATGKYFTAENVAVYGFNAGYISLKDGRGNVYNDASGDNDGSAAGIYVEYADSTNNGALFSVPTLSDSVWTVVDGVPMLIRMSGEGVAPSTCIPEITVEDGYLVKDNVTAYSIAWDATVDGTTPAVQFINAKMQQSTGARLAGSVADLNDFSKKQIIVGSYGQYETVVSDLIADVSLSSEANYGIYVIKNTIFVLADNEESFDYAAQLFCREFFGYTQLAENSYTIDTLDSVAMLEDGYAYTTNVTFAARGDGSNVTNAMGFGDWQVQPFSQYESMHNALLYVESYTGSDKANLLATDSDSVLDNNDTAGEQVCYLARGNATSFGNFIDHVAGIIVEKAKLNPKMNAINFMLEDNKDYCACDACAQFTNPSIPQLIFLNELAAKLAEDDIVNELGKVLSVEFFSYNSYAAAPILSETDKTALDSLITSLGLTNQATTTFTYADMNAAGATYDAAISTTEHTVLKAADNLRLWWTSHEASHSFALTHAANDHMYLALLGWIASMGTPEHIDVFMYETAYRDYFIPLNTWQYQVEWYQAFNKLGIDNYISNLGDVHNSASSQTGFMAFKTYIDSRAMTDCNVTFEQLKDEFFSTNGYYGAAGPIMRTFFEELVTVMEGHKQDDALAVDDYIDGSQLNYSNTTDAQWRQSFFNGVYGLNKVAFAFPKKSFGTDWTCTVTGATDLYVHSSYDTQIKTLEAWYNYCQTALTAVDGDATYTKRINVEAVFPEYAILLLNTTYISKIWYISNDTWNTSGGITATFNGSAIYDGVDTSTKTVYQQFYEKVIALGFTHPSEFYAWNGTSVNSLGSGYGVTYGLYESSFMNWGVTF